jgi:hypothetical protein
MEMEKGQLLVSQAIGGTYTVTYGNGVSDPLPYNATAEKHKAACIQAAERNTLPGYLPAH